jgi:transcriptional regulator with XRE-family HTH domain
MIQQPELGKKIADLRKAKGLTQEELVERCDLNVRTLQRIESGEVTPRTYTIRLIFEALDFSFEKSQSDKGLIQKWLEQFYISFIDLFNLKTNTMKKISILSIMLSAITFGLFTLTTEINAQNESKAKSQLTDNNSSKQSSGGEMIFSNFSCENCFDDNDDMIGRDVKFENSGVKIKIGLIKLNRKTREFKSGYITGKILQNKVELTCPKDMLNDSSVKYTADKVEQLGDKILLKGNAKLASTQNDSIEADEIIITLN